MKLDKNNIEINHMIVDADGESFEVHCPCWQADLPSVDKSISYNVGFMHFGNEEQAANFGWGKLKQTWICKECVEAMKEIKERRQCHLH